MSPSVVNHRQEPWSALEQELDAWVSSNQTASLWWRDDDAVAPGQKLDRLITLTGLSGLLLAVIPVGANNLLVEALTNVSHVHIAQHGYAHVNHAPRGQGLGAWELGLHCGEAAVMADLAAGRERLEGLFGALFMPVIVPPWNRLAPELLGPIVASGYRGVSAFGSTEGTEAPADLVIANAHCDPIRWKKGATFAGEYKTMSQLVAHLQARRCGQLPNDEHTGFLTHHIDLDEAGWTFCQRLSTIINDHSGSQWISPAAVFGVCS